MIIMALGAGMAGCQREEEPPQMPPPGVIWAKPLQMEVTEFEEYTAQLEAVESVELRPRVSGYIDSIHFTEGETVEKGDLLFVIDQRPFKAALSSAEAELFQRQAARTLAEANAARAEALLADKAISKEEADVRESEALQAAANEEQAEAELRQEFLQLEFTEVRAPISGIAGRRLVTVGNLVQGGTGNATLLTTIVPHKPIHAYFEINEAAFLRGLRRYMAGEIPGRNEEGLRPIQMQLADEKGFPHEGTVDFINNTINPSTATIELRGVFDNEDEMLTPGMFARVRISAGTEENAILVPQASIVADLTARFVWVLTEDGTADRRKVTLGARHGALRTVIEGIEADDKVITEGFAMLSPGMQVTPSEGKIEPPSEEELNGGESINVF